MNHLNVTLQHHNSPANCVRELFKYSKDAASPLDYIFYWKVFDFSFFVSDATSGISFRPFWLKVPGPGPQLLDIIFY